MRLDYFNWLSFFLLTTVRVNSVVERTNSGTLVLNDTYMQLAGTNHCLTSPYPD